MEYCKFHPLSPATYACTHCHTVNCDLCVDEGSIASDEKCFICDAPVESLGAVNTAIPFWRRLEDSFKYPLATQTIILILSVSFINALLDFVPFTFIWQLALFGTMMKYCFECLVQSAEGNLVAPPVESSFGGLEEARGIILLILTLIASVIVTGLFIDTSLASFLAFFYMLGVPATLINYSYSHSVFDAINPAAIIKLVKAIGLPYGLVVGFMLIMTGSVATIQELIGYDFSVLSNGLQSVVSYYYMVVMFHILGYMLFQYQGQLGFTATDSSQEKNIRTAPKKLRAHISVLIKSGEYEKAKETYKQYLHQNRKDRQVYRQYFEFLVACKNDKWLADFATDYMAFLIENNQKDKLVFTHKRVLAIAPSFVPSNAVVRHKLAEQYFETGAFKTVIQLINGMLKQHAKYPELLECYQVLLNSLQQLPNMEKQIAKFQTLINKLEIQRQRSRAADSHRLEPNGLALQPAAALSQADRPSENIDVTPASSLSLEPMEAKGGEEGSNDLPPLDFKL